jgi:hypothetical protein
MLQEDSTEALVPQIWDPEEGTKLNRLEGHQGWVYRMQLFETEDGRNHLASADFGAGLRIWDLGEAFRSAGTIRAANKLG